MDYSVSPSSLTFQMEHCPACWHHQVTKKWKKPFGGMPRIFNQIDRVMKEGFHGKPAALVIQSVGALDHAGTFRTKTQEGKEISVKSAMFPTPAGNTFRISGKLDSLVELDSGSVIVVDFKTSDPMKGDEIDPGIVQLYAPQLYAYKLALTNPSLRKNRREVEGLALVTLTPERLRISYEVDSLDVKLRCIPIPISSAGERRLLARIAELIDEVPEDNPNCRDCKLRRIELDTIAPTPIVDRLLSL